MSTFQGVVRAGSQITAKLLDNLIAEIKANRIIASSTVAVSRGVNGTTLNVLTSGRGGRAGDDVTQPWDLAVHSLSDSDPGQVEVYLPVGTMTTDADCEPLNVRCRDVNGHEDDEVNWFFVRGLPSVSQPVTKRVEACVMPGRHMVVRVKPDEEDGFSEGCLVRYEIGEVSYVVPNEGEGSPHWIVSDQFMRGAKTFQVQVNWQNWLDYTLEAENDGGKKVSAIKVRDVFFTAGGIELRGDDKEVSAEDTSLWIRIRHDSADYTVSIGKNLDEAVAKSNDDWTYIRIYEMKDGYPTRDYRSALVNVPFYR